MTAYRGLPLNLCIVHLNKDTFPCFPFTDMNINILYIVLSSRKREKTDLIIDKL